MKHLLCAIIFFYLFMGSFAAAEENYCYVNAPEQSDIWAIVYRASKDGDRGDAIWEGKIPAGEKIKITCDTGHIRYDYAMEEGQAYQGDLNRWCNGGEDIQLP